VSRAKEIGVLDGLVARVLQAYPYRFTVATTSADKAVAFGLRGPVVGADVDRDDYDDVAVHVIGWADDVAVSTPSPHIPARGRTARPARTCDTPDLSGHRSPCELRYA
jgi:hypothetical protein